MSLMSDGERDCQMGLHLGTSAAGFCQYIMYDFSEGRAEL